MSDDYSEEYVEMLNQKNEALLAQVEELYKAAEYLHDVRRTDKERYAFFRALECPDREPIASLKSRIEEETIDWCASEVFSYKDIIGEQGWSTDNVVQLIESIPRKYQTTELLEK